jgi:hypothetical protein
LNREKTIACWHIQKDQGRQSNETGYL